jgi:hypothetical protein
MMKKGVSGLIMAAGFTFALAFTGCENPATSTDPAGSVAVSGVSLNYTSFTVAVSETVTLVATVSPADADNQTVTWSSDNTEVATVDSNGAVTGVANGNATITVTTVDGSKSATCDVTVKILASIVLTEPPTKTDYYIGEEIDLTGLVVTATWSDESEESIVITADHLDKSEFTESDAGNDPVTITITYDEETVDFTVTVRYEITSVTVTPSEADVAQGQSKTFQVTVAVKIGTSPPSDVTWSIVEAKTDSTTQTDTGTTITEGGVLTVAANETLSTLTVKAVSTYDEDKSDTATVTVIPVPNSITVSVPPTKTSYYIGEEIDLAGLVVTAVYTDSTANKQIKGITKDNLSKSVFEEADVGTKSITVTYGGKEDTFTVTVRYKITAVTVSPVTADVYTTGPSNTTTFMHTVTVAQGTSLPDEVKAVTWSIVEAKTGSTTETEKGTTINASTGALTVAAGETLPTLTVKAVSQYEPTKSNTATVSVITVVTADNWASTLSAISSATGGTADAPKVWTLDVQNDVTVTGVSAANITGNYKEVRLTGTGKITLSNTGSIIRTNTGAKAIIDGPTLKGYSPAQQSSNNAPVVYVEGGSVELRSGKIIGNKNTISNSSDVSNGGVYVAKNAEFTMTGGEISGNLLWGGGGDDARNSGGVYVGGTFTMSGGTIKDNEGHMVGGVWVDGEFTMSGEAEVSGNINGGILVGEDGKFTMSGGKVSGHENLTNEEYPDESYGGTGVIVRGTFIMNGTAEISGNEDSGVNVDARTNDNNTALLYRGDFTMSGGTISSNSSPSKGGNMGGGVSVMGSFKMQGGTIKGNTGAFGGGVYVMSPPIQPAEFTMTNGTINGSDSTDPNTATGQANMIEQSKAGAAVFYMFYAIGTDKMIYTYFYRDTALTGSNTMPASASASIPTSAWGKGTMEIDVPEDNN